jgi:hypothetical protein
MTTNPASFKELQQQIRELEVRKDIQRSELNDSVHQFSESLKPENILLFLAGKLVGRWVDKQHEKEEKESFLKNSLVGFAKKFASGALEKVVEMFTNK